MITASELGKLAARVKVAADPTFRKSDTVMPSVPGSSAPKPPVAPYAPNPKSGPGGGKENWDYAPQKPNVVSPKMPTSAPTPTSSNADETTSQRLKKLRESLSDAAPASPAAKFEFDRAMKKIPEPAAAAPPAAVPPVAPPAAPPADNRPAVPAPPQPSKDWYETWRDDLKQKMSKRPPKIKYPDHTKVTAEEMAGYPSARSVEMGLLHDRQKDFDRLERDLYAGDGNDPNRMLLRGIYEDMILGDPNRVGKSGLLANTPALLGGLAASATGNPVAGAQLVAGAASNIAHTVRNLRTNLTDPVFSSQEIQEELRKKMQERLAENDRYHALEKFVEYPDQTELQKLRATPARTPPVLPFANRGFTNSPMRSAWGTSRFMRPFDELTNNGRYAFSGPDGIPVGGRPFLDTEKNEDSKNRAFLREKEEKMRFETQPHFPNLAPNMPNFGIDRKTYVHPDTRYTFENADNAPGLGDDKTNIFLPHAVRRFPNAPDERGYGLLNTSEQFPKYLEDRILKAHREGKYPTRAERERAKQKLIPQELADPNTAHGAAQRTIRELYDPAKEGINTDIIPPDVLRRNDPVEIRYYAQKAKIMQGR
jgi:hypothetical protein